MQGSKSVKLKYRVDNRQKESYLPTSVSDAGLKSRKRGVFVNWDSEDRRMEDPWGFLPTNRYRYQRCFECGEQTAGRHHVVPVTKGGTKVIPLCSKCHAVVHDGVELSPLIKHGLEKARARGVVLGAPTKVTLEIVEQVGSLKRAGQTYKQISKELGLSVGTIHKLVHMGTSGD